MDYTCRNLQCKRKKYNFSKSKAEEIYGKAKELVPVFPKDETTKRIIRQAVDHLNRASSMVEELRTLMNDTASNFLSILSSWK